MRTFRRAELLVLLAASALAGAAVTNPADDYSQRLDALWDFAGALAELARPPAPR